MTNYEPVIGLEVHAQLATLTKMFCRCAVKNSEDPNSQTCPICTGHPGTLPVINIKAIKLAIKTGLAAHCRINPDNIFARKHYFYPDLPKGFQISQYDQPICQDGYLEIPGKTIRIKRMHLEEDAGKSVHGEHHSYIDLNRAGTPLLEIVSEPDLHSSKEAGIYLRKLYELVTTLEVCDGKLEEGNFRCDANVSLRPVGTEPLGTRTELKNINSFKFLEKAIEVEIARQTEVLNSGQLVIQETRGYDSQKNISYSMRTKEDAHDYRYFPEPDLPKISKTLIETLVKNTVLPELPEDKKRRISARYLTTETETQILISNPELLELLESSKFNGPKQKQLINYLIGPVLQLINQAGFASCQLSIGDLEEIIERVEMKQISGTAAKEVIIAAWNSGENVDTLITELNLSQNSDQETLLALIKEVLSKNPEQVATYLQGKTTLLAYFTGQVMKASKGKANPKLTNELLMQELEARKNALPL